MGDQIPENCFPLSVSSFPSIPNGLASFETVNLGLGFVENLRQIHTLQELL